MIYHLFPGKMQHHVPLMIQYFIDNFKNLDIKNEEQVFVIYDNKESEYDCYNKSRNKITFLKNSFWELYLLIKNLQDNDCLIIHSAFYRYLWLALLLNINKLNSIAFINWGAGVQKGSGIKSIIYLYIKKTVFPLLGAISTLTPKEYEYLKVNYGCNGNYIRAFYPAIINSCKQSNKRGTCEILLGNSAWEANRHIEIISWLQRYSNEDIKIICPLGYPDNKPYKEKVYSFGKKMLGNKFHIINDMLSNEEFANILEPIDIYISNATNQQGLYSIYSFLCKGSKVFIRNESEIFDMLLNLGFSVSNTNDIRKINFAQFKKFSTNEREKNIKLFSTHLSYNASINGWKNLLNKIKS